MKFHFTLKLLANKIGELFCRQEAVDMLCDLAVRKLSPGTSSGSSCKQSSGTSCNSPRRLRRLATRTPTADNDQGIVIFGGKEGRTKLSCC